MIQKPTFRVPKNRNQDFGSKKNRNQDFGSRAKIVGPRPRKEPFFFKGYFPGCFGVPGIYIYLQIHTYIVYTKTNIYVYIYIYSILTNILTNTAIYYNCSFRFFLQQWQYYEKNTIIHDKPTVLFSNLPNFYEFTKRVENRRSMTRRCRGRPATQSSRLSRPRGVMVFMATGVSLDAGRTCLF